MSEETTQESQQSVKGPGKRIYIWLGLLVVVGGIAALTLPGKSKFEAAISAAENVNADSADEPPVAFMKAIGQTPMVKVDKEGKLVQVYRWSGGIKTYEVRITFKPINTNKTGYFLGMPDIATTGQPFFMTESLDGFELAKENTGSTFADLPKLEVPNPFTQSGRGGNRNPMAGKGGSRPGGGRPGGSRPNSKSPFGPPAELGLTDDQKSKWTEAAEKMREKFNTLRETPADERAARFQEIRSEFESELEKFLTADQLKKYKEISQQRRQKGKGGGGGGGFQK